jgi:putative tryptophan/tyrosine transport system substrate-binding protein
MKRREFLGLVGVAAAWPLTARAQPKQTRRVGVLMNFAESDPVTHHYLLPFRHALEAAGWTEGRNLVIDYRWDIRNAEGAKANASELLSLNPDAILSSGAVSLAALYEATRSVPVVFVLVSDPVTLGFLPSLARPGANITGFASLEFSIGGKWIQLLREILPGLSRIAVFFAPQVSPYAEPLIKATIPIATAASVGVEPVPLRTSADIEPAINSLRTVSDGMVVLQDAFTISNRNSIIRLANEKGMRALYSTSNYVRAGGLISYGPDLSHQFGQAATYVDRILRGEKPGDLPVQQPTKFELVINLKVAKTLGLDVPTSILLRADAVIE